MTITQLLNLILLPNVLFRYRKSAILNIFTVGSYVLSSTENVSANLVPIMSIYGHMTNNSAIL